MSEREVLWEGKLPMGSIDRLVSHKGIRDDCDLEGCYVHEFRWSEDEPWNRIPGLEQENTSMVIQIARQLAAAEARLERAANMLAKPPTFRDYTGTDEATCGYCHAPLENPIIPEDEQHLYSCQWLRLRAIVRAEEVEDE